VVYGDSLNSAKGVMLMYNGTNWVTVGNAGFSTGGALLCDLTFNNGVAYVAYEDQYNNAYHCRVMSLSGGDWTSMGNINPSLEVYATPLGFIGSTPYLACMDTANNDKATVLTYDGSDWVTLGAPDFTAGPAWFLTGGVNDSAPYVAFSDGAVSNNKS
jgi:hypothetical protein